MKGSMRTFVTDRLTDGRTDSAGFIRTGGVGKMLNHMNFENFFWVKPDPNPRYILPEHLLALPHPLPCLYTL